MTDRIIKFPFYLTLEDYHDGPEHAHFLSRVLGGRQVLCKELHTNDAQYAEGQTGYMFKFFLKGAEND